jgi:hypothetical protein
LLLTLDGASDELYFGQSSAFRFALRSLTSDFLASASSIDLDEIATAPCTGAPAPLMSNVLLTWFGDCVMSKVYKLMHWSSPFTIVACTAVVFFLIGSASDAPESTHDDAGLNSITLAFVSQPPIRTAWSCDHGRRIGLTVGGATDWYDVTPYGATVLMVNVWEDKFGEPSCDPAYINIEFEALR